MSLLPSALHHRNDRPTNKKDDEQDRCSRTIQWAIELGQFDIEYWPRAAIKAQVLANNLTDFTYPYKEEELPMEIWTIQIDGFSTKKVEGAGEVLISPEKEILKYAV